VIFNGDNAQSYSIGLCRTSTDRDRTLCQRQARKPRRSFGQFYPSMRPGTGARVASDPRRGDTTLETRDEPQDGAGGYVGAPVTALAACRVGKPMDFRTGDAAHSRPGPLPGFRRVVITAAVTAQPVWPASASGVFFGIAVPGLFDNGARTARRVSAGRGPSVAPHTSHEIIATHRFSTEHTSNSSERLLQDYSAKSKTPALSPLA